MKMGILDMSVSLIFFKSVSASGIIKL